MDQAEQKTNRIFPIIGLSPDGSKRITGTGFFINAAGEFITAAHTFKNSTAGWEFYAVINGQRLAMIPILHEYADLDKQLAPVHLDLFIGRLKLTTENEYYDLRNSGLLKKGDLLDFRGYGQTRYYDEDEVDEQIVIIQSDSEIKTIDDLWDNAISNTDDDDLQDNGGFEHLLVNSDHEFNEDIDEKDNKQSLSNEDCLDERESLWLNTIIETFHSELTGTYTNPEFEKIFDMLDVEGVFSNGFRFQLTNNKLSPAGLSGGPILNDGQVVGMLITKDAAICSEYLIKCLGERKVSFEK